MKAYVMYVRMCLKFGVYFPCHVIRGIGVYVERFPLMY